MLNKRMKKVISLFSALSLITAVLPVFNTGVQAAGLSTLVEIYFESGYQVQDGWVLNYESISKKTTTADPIVNGNNVGLPGNGWVYYGSVSEMANPVSGWGMVKRNSGTWGKITTNITDILQTGVLSFKFKMSNAAYVPYLHAYLADAAGSTTNFVGVNISDQYTEEDVNTWKVINVPLKDFVSGQNIYKYKENLETKKIHGAGIMFPNAYDVKEEVTFWFDDMYIRNVLAPTDLKVVDSDNQSATLSWEASISDVLGYEILRDDVVIGETDAETLQFTDTGLDALTTYKYSVRALDSYRAISNRTNEASVFTALTGKPNNLTVKSGFADELKAELSWEAPAYGDIAGYNVYRDGTLIAELDASAFTYTDRDGVSNNTEYNYYVVSVADGGEESMPSNNVSIYVANVEMPKNLVATVSGQDITLSWDSANGAVKYNVYCNGEKVGETQNCQFIHSNREYSKSYIYTITVVNSLDMESLPSNEVLKVIASPNSTRGEEIYGDLAADGFEMRTIGSSKFEMDRTIVAKDNSALKILFETGSNVLEGITLVKNLDLSAERTNGGVLAFFVYAEDEAQAQDVKIGFECTSDKLGNNTYTARTYVDISDYIDNYGMWNYVEIPIKDFPEIGKYTPGISEASQVFKFDQIKAISIFTNNAQYMEEKVVLFDDIHFQTNTNYVVTPPAASEIALSVNSASVTAGSIVLATVKAQQTDTVLKSADITLTYNTSVLGVANESAVVLSDVLKNAGATVTLTPGMVKVTLPQNANGVVLGSEPVKISFTAAGAGTTAIMLTGTGVEKDTDTALTFVQPENAQITVIPLVTGGGSSHGGGGSSSGGGRDTATIYPTVNIPVSDGKTDVKDNEEKEDIFPDLDSASWAKEAINYLYDKEYISGYPDNTFKPDNNVTREEFIKMLLSSLSSVVEDTEECTFEDADKDAWYYKYLAVAERDGVITGYEGKFGVGEFITRQDMCTMALRAAGTYQVPLKKLYDSVVFIDAEEASDYAKDGIVKLYEAGVVNGVGEGKFEPKTNVTRAMAAKIIYELVQLKG